MLEENNKKFEISIEDFKKIEIKLGEIMAVEKVSDTDKLLRLEVDFKEEKLRQIVSAIALYFPEIDKLIGKKCFFITNLETKIIRGLESQGMILAITDEKDNFSLLVPEKDLTIGSKAK